MTSVVTHHAYDNRAQRAVDATMRNPDSVQSVYQPIVELATGSVVAYEALARWPSIGDVNPEAVFAAARATAWHSRSSGRAEWQRSTAP